MARIKGWQKVTDNSQQESWIRDDHAYITISNRFQTTTGLWNVYVADGNSREVFSVPHVLSRQDARKIAVSYMRRNQG